MHASCGFALRRAPCPHVIVHTSVTPPPPASSLSAPPLQNPPYTLRYHSVSRPSPFLRSSTQHCAQPAWFINASTPHHLSPAHRSTPHRRLVAAGVNATDVAHLDGCSYSDFKALPPCIFDLLTAEPGVNAISTQLCRAFRHDCGAGLFELNIISCHRPKFRSDGLA